MSGEGVVINMFERAASSDINTLQEMGARQLGELLKWLGSEHTIPADNHLGTSNVRERPEPWFAGLVVERLGSTSYRIGPGLLGIQNPANLTQGGLDSTFRIGHQRSSLTRDYPTANPARVGGEFHLLSVRIIREVTLNLAVEIFDVPTQTFIPVANDKQTEMNLEFRTDAGPQIPSLAAFGAWPALDEAPSGQGWEPLAILKVFPDTSQDDHGQVIDLRRDLRDVLGAAMSDSVPSSDVCALPPVVLQRRLESTGSGSDTGGHQFGVKGLFQATLQGQRFALSQPLTDSPVSYVGNTLDSLTDDKLSHIYLVPLVQGGRKLVPSYVQATAGGSGYALQRGVLVHCQDACPPTRDGKNSAAIRLPSSGAGGVFVGYDDIPAGEAVHVASAQSRTGGAGWLRPFALAGGVHRYPLNVLGETNFMSGPRVVNQPAIASGVNVFAMDLRSYVPRNARTVTIAVVLTPGPTAAGASRCLVRVGKEGDKVPGTAAFLAERVLATTAIPAGYANTQWWGELTFPVHTPNPANPEDTDSDAGLNLGLELDYQVLSGSTFGSCGAVAFVVGWDLGQ